MFDRARSWSRSTSWPGAESSSTCGSQASSRRRRRRGRWRPSLGARRRARTGKDRPVSRARSVVRCPGRGNGESGGGRHGDRFFVRVRSEIAGGGSCARTWGTSRTWAVPTPRECRHAERGPEDPAHPAFPSVPRVGLCVTALSERVPTRSDDATRFALHESTRRVVASTTGVPFGSASVLRWSITRTIAVAFRYVSSERRARKCAMSTAVRRSVTSTTHRPVRGSTAAKRLADPHRLYSSSTRAGVPGPAATGSRVCSRSCLLVSSRQTCGRSPSPYGSRPSCSADGRISRTRAGEA
jgi:hypothetical protein